VIYSDMVKYCNLLNSSTMLTASDTQTQQHKASNRPAGAQCSCSQNVPQEQSDLVQDH